MAEEKKESNKKRPTALKRDIQHEKRRLQNRSFKSTVKTAVHSLEKQISEKNDSGAKEELGKVYSLIDKGVKKGIFKLNKASRLKAKFSGRI